MTNPSELVRRWQDIRARMEAVPEDTPYIDVFADAVEWAADAIQAADTISTGEAVEVPHYSSKDAEFDRLLALGTAEANEFLTWLKANPGETLSPFAQRALAHTFGFIMDKATSPREGHVEVPVERSAADDLNYLLECVSAHADKFPVPTHMTALVARVRAALIPTKPEAKEPTAPEPPTGEEELAWEAYVAKFDDSSYGKPTSTDFWPWLKHRRALQSKKPE